MMISPGVMIADYLRNPSLVGCKQLYYITEAGHALTGLPVGHTMNSRTKRMKMEIIRPYSQIVRPVYKDLRKIVFIQVRVGQRLEIECEGIAWEDFDYMYWLTKPCRNDKCELDFIPSEGRMIEQSMNTSLVESMLGYPISQKLVLDPVDKSDLKSTFYCKLESSGVHDILTVYLRERDEMFGLADSIYQR